MNSVSDECTTDSFSHKKSSFSQNPTAQKLNVLETAIWSQNLETYLFVSGLFALVHRKSPSMTMSTNHDTMTMKDCMEPTGEKKQTKPSNISDKKSSKEAEISAIYKMRQKFDFTTTIQVILCYLHEQSFTIRILPCLQKALYATAHGNPNFPIPPVVENGVNTLP